MRSIKSLQNTIDQGIRLDSVDLTANGDYTSIFEDKRPFLLDLPADGTMKVQFKEGHIGTYIFKYGTDPIVKISKVFDEGSEIKQFQVIY